MWYQVGPGLAYTVPGQTTVWYQVGPGLAFTVPGQTTVWYQVLRKGAGISLYGS